MKLAALLFTLLIAGCSEARPVVDPSEFALRLFATNGDKGIVCSATAVGPHEIETAAHCLQFRLQTISNPTGGVGSPTIVASRATGVDRVRVTLSGVTFAKWAKPGKAKQGERVRFWGQPLGFPFVYREGHVAAVYADGFVVDATTCHGDSGSGLFSDAGELVGIVSAVSDEYGCTFLAAR